MKSFKFMTCAIEGCRLLGWLDKTLPQPTKPEEFKECELNG
jgi:hypothetical protein